MDLRYTWVQVGDPDRGNDRPELLPLDQYSRNSCSLESPGELVKMQTADSPEFLIQATREIWHF